MKKNKLVSLLLAGVMSASILTACGTKTASQETKQPGTTQATSTAASESTTGIASVTPAELTFSWWGNQARNERTQKVIDLYTQNNPGVTIDGQFTEWKDYWNKLSTSAAGHMLPDVVQMDYGYLEQYVSNKLLVDLTPYIQNGTLDVSAVNENILNSGKVNGAIYAIPVGVNAPALMYNKTLLDKSGITVKDNMSLTEFTALCKEIYEKTGYKTDMAYGQSSIFAEYMMRSVGAVLFEKDKLGPTQEQMQQFFNVYEKGIAEGWMCDPSIYTERTIGTPEQMPLVYGSSPATMSWCAFSYSNALTALQKAAPEGTAIAMTTWPADDQKKANFLKPSMFFSITVDSKNPDATAKFINYWINDIPANEILLGERGVPISSKIADAILSKMDDYNQKAIQYINNVVTLTSSTINPPAPQGSAEVSKLIDQAVEKVCYKKSTAVDAAAEIYESGNKLLAK